MPKHARFGSAVPQRPVKNYTSTATVLPKQLRDRPGPRYGERGWFGAALQQIFLLETTLSIWSFPLPAAVFGKTGDCKSRWRSAAPSGRLQIRQPGLAIGAFFEVDRG